MKSYIQLLTLLSTALVPIAVIAGDNAPTDSLTIEMPATNFKFKNETPWIRPVPKRVITLPPLIKPQPESAFPYHLPFAGKKQDARKIDLKSTSFHSNMPVLRRKVTSKILIAKLDSIYPYHYKMPVKKVETSDD